MFCRGFLVASLLAAAAVAAANPLYAATTAADVAKALADGAELNDRNGPGKQSPVMAAVLGGKTAVVKALLEKGADLTIPEGDGYTPIHGAGFQGRFDLVPLLANRGGISVSDVHKDGFTPLQRACWGRDHRHTQTVEAFLKAGAKKQELHKCLEMTPSEHTRKLCTSKMGGQSSDGNSPSTDDRHGLGEL